VTDEGGDDDGGGQDVQRHERELGGGVVGPGDRRDARQRGERHGRLRKRRRGERLRLSSTARTTPPITAPRKVAWAKPASGITSPSTSNDTPAAWTAAAIAVVTAAATSPATTVVRRSELARRTACGSVTVGEVGVVTDMAFTLGSAAPDASLVTSTNATARIDTRTVRRIFRLPCRNRRARS
jgi:hypothetical protein